MGLQYRLGADRLQSSSAAKSLLALEDDKSTMTQRHVIMANKANSLLSSVRRMLGEQTEEGDPALLLSTGKRHLECLVQCWAHQYKRHLHILERVQ